MKEIKMLTVVLPHTSQKVATLFSMYPCGLYARNPHTHICLRWLTIYDRMCSNLPQPRTHITLSLFSLISAVMFCCFYFKSSMLLSRNWWNNNETANSCTMRERFEDLNVFCVYVRRDFNLPFQSLRHLEFRGFCRFFTASAKRLVEHSKRTGEKNP